MTERTVEDDMKWAALHAAEAAAEKHFYDKNQPHFPLGFGVHHRNPGHWDVMAAQCPGRVSAWLASHPGGSMSGRDGGGERAFAIRGEPGKVYVRDERWNPHIDRGSDERIHKFRSVMAAMVWICEELMQEPSQEGTDAGR